MQRVCFLLKVREDRLAEYRERHAAVWPEMLEALSATGWHNYSLFLRDDGLLVGYLETEEVTGLEPGALEHKFYAPGVGNVLTVDLVTGDTFPLVQIK